jgi:uncharacterized protein (DUF885 family)
MKQTILSFLIILVMASCNNKPANVTKEANKEMAAMLDKYYEERLQLFPLEATSNGDNRYNDKLYADFTDSYRETLQSFYSKYFTEIEKFKRNDLNDNDKISYDVFKREMAMSVKGLTFQDNLTPLNQFWGKHLDMGQLGSGDGNQPFKTIKDYEDWTKRATAFSRYIDSAIVYFKKGMDANYVLPKSLVVKIIPQCKNIIVDDVTKSLFWGPIAKLPSTFSDADKQRITADYTKLIKEQIIPSYKKLGDFLEKEYLSKARATSGISANATGGDYYKYLIEQWTTTNKTPDEIYNKGLEEVKRIRNIMEKVKTEVKFNGDLKTFFEFMKTDKQFMPYKTPEEVLAAFHFIQTKIDPKLQTMFGRTPETKFEIRQTEAFRAASASAEYNQGSADGTRPGIFYVPIIDATKFNTTSGMESLFLHEAIPGHHYQISLQQENESLPKFRRFSWYGAYGEGWALYCESLGKELGCYTDPYQYMGALGDEIHRGIRLVVDVAIHTKNMTREEAIKYMVENEAISEEGATAEIERYMAIPAQALSYKTGALKIKELREKYSKQNGAKFSLKAYHDEFLKDGCLPLDVLEKKMDDWAKKN